MHHPVRGSLYVAGSTSFWSKALPPRDALTWAVKAGLISAIAFGLAATICESVPIDLPLRISSRWS
jgi:hypothetical protein